MFKILHAMLGMLYLTIIYSASHILLEFFRKNVEVKPSLLAQYAFYLFVPALLVATIDKLLVIFAPREHEQFFMDNVTTTIQETIIMAFPNIVKGLLWSIPMMVVDYAVNTFVAFDITKSIAGYLNWPFW